ncbi:hypothetical protein VNO78_00288 [Psophocarpus tetragonolobus]|uniref:CCHC-type domain-containing protein n=1 Tax=Psophocarpus tetragonolobus TaxID=3891 RepID=A0AAN9T077_PSOTE
MLGFVQLCCVTSLNSHRIASIQIKVKHSNRTQAQHSFLRPSLPYATTVFAPLIREKFQALATNELKGGVNESSSTTSLFNNVMVECLELSEKGSRSKKHHDVAIKYVRKEIGELDLLESMELCKKFGNLKDEVVPNISNDTITLCDPLVLGTKGCPQTLRMKASLELFNKGCSSCGHCKKKGHNKHKCPSLNQLRYR